MSTEVLNKLKELDKTIHDFKELDDARYSELKAKGVESPELRAAVDKANAEIDRINTEVRAAQNDAQKRVDDLEAALNRQQLYSKDSGKVAEAAARFYSRIRNEVIDPSDVDVDAYIDYRNKYARYLRHDRDALGAGVIEVLNTAREGSDADGGFFVPDEMESSITRRLFRTSPMRQICTVRSIGVEAFTFLVKDTKAASGGWVGEQGTSSETNTPTYRKARIPAHKQFAEPHITEEILDDATISIENEVSEAVAEIMSETENTAFVNGNGADKPKGFLQYSTSSSNEDDSPARSWGTLQYVPAGASGAFPNVSGSLAADGGAFIDLQQELEARYRANANWLMNRGTFATVRKLRDADGNYFWERSYKEGIPFTLLGSPVVEAEDMPDIAADSLSIAYGDFKAGYWIIQRQGIRVLRDPYTTKGVVKYYTTARVGGDVKNFDAIKLMKFAAS